VREFVRRRLREDLGLSEPRLFGLSALEALEATVQAGRGIAASWLERRAGEVLELLTGMVADQISVLLEGARSPGMLGAEIAGVAGSDDHRGPGGWTADDVPGLAVQPPEWTVQVPLPRRFGRKLDGGDTELRHHLADALNTAISAFEAGSAARRTADRRGIRRVPRRAPQARWPARAQPALRLTYAFKMALQEPVPL
jgi:hypothetical protein